MAQSSSQPEVHPRPARLNRGLRLLGGLGLALLLAPVAPAAGTPPPASPASRPDAALLEFAGTVEFAGAGTAAWNPAQRGQALQPGDRLRTGPDSRATVRLSDRSVIRLNQRTWLQIQAPQAAGGRARFRLERGSLFFLNREKPRDLEFETPLVTGAVRGTEFLLEVDDSPGAARLALADGEVELVSPTDRRVLSGPSAAEIRAGEAIQVHPVQAFSTLIQWCLYYPAVLNPDDLALAPAERATLAASLAACRAGDLLEARRLLVVPQEPASPAVRVYLAALKLAFGQVAEATRLLEGAPAGDGATAGLRRLIAAVTGVEGTAVPPPATSTEWLAVSYERQARADLDGALAAAERATAMAPGFGLGWARRAELHFSFGHWSAARAALARARELAPENAQAAAWAGFVELERNRPRAARARFDEAIARDGALGDAWLGRGLAEAAQGETGAARRDLQTAAALEPQRALYRSYLGKAWAQAGFDGLADKELRLAKQLDPADPTAWLYSGLHRFQSRELNPAVRDLEHSVALNDQRGVFRSRLRLDQDRAIRSADLAAVYRAAGADELSERLAVRAIQDDYTGFSGHLLMARRLQSLEDPTRFDLRLETPRQSELLLANLLAPAGGGNLSQLLSQPEHLQYFDPRPVGVSSYTEYRSAGDWRQAGTVFGDVGGLSYAVDGEYQSLTGQAPGSAFEESGYSTQLRQQLGAADSLYLQAGYRRNESGDVAHYYDPNQARRDFHVHELQEPALYAGWHHEWAPGIHTLLLAARVADRLSLTNPEAAVVVVRQHQGTPTSVLVDPFFNLQYESDLAIYAFDCQQVFATAAQSLVLGARYAGGQVDAEARLDRNLSGRVSQQAYAGDVERFALYAYENWHPLPPLRLTAGLSYDTLEHPLNLDTAPLAEGEDHHAQWSPRAGLTWDPWRGGTLRAAAAHTLGGGYLEDTLRLEPTQVAGFLTTYRSLIPESVAGIVPGAAFTTYGAGFDQALGPDTHLGMSAVWLRSEGNRVIGAMTNALPVPIPDSPSTTRQELAFEERSLALYATRLLARDWVIGARYRISAAELHGRFPELPAGLPGLAGLEQDEHSTLQQARLFAGFNHRCGFFAEWASDWYQQSNRGYTPDRPGDDFWQHAVFIGYRFPRRHAEIRCGVLNLADQDYRLNPLNLHDDLMRQRTFVTSLRLSF